MNAYSVGGTIRATFNSAAELAKRHDVEIVSVYRKRAEPRLPLDPAVRLRPLTDLRGDRLTMPWHTATASRPSRLMHTGDIRYTHFNLLTDANLLAFLMSLDDGVVIGTRPAVNLAVARFVSDSVVRIGQDQMHLGFYRPELRSAMAQVYPRLDAVAALTQRTVDDYRELLRGTTRVEQIPNGVPDPGVRAPLDGKVVIGAGRLTPQKGFDRLLRTWAKVAPRHPDWELRIFGPPERGDYQQLIDELQIGDSARLMGPTSTLADELAASSLYVLSSRFEGFPLVLLEAMSVGLPVVSFDCPTGPREIIDHGVEGYVVPNGDEDALGNAMSDLMADDAKRRSFGPAAAEKARQYNPAAIAERWEALAEELAAKKGASRRSPVRAAAKLVAGRQAATGPRRSWKEAVNAGLVRLTGYQLVKAQPPNSRDSGAEAPPPAVQHDGRERANV